MPVIVDADSARAGALASRSADRSQVVVSTLDQRRRLAGRRPSEYAVLVGPELDIETAMAVAERLRLKRPGLRVLLLRHELGTEIFASSMAAGIREVLAADDHESLRTAVERTPGDHRRAHGPTGGRTNGRVITVFSPKGGVGKTTVAVNLGARALGQRSQPGVPGRPRPLPSVTSRSRSS